MKINANTNTSILARREQVWLRLDWEQRVPKKLWMDAGYESLAEAKKEFNDSLKY